MFTALDTGQICRSKAWLFTELCAELTDEQAQTVAERLLPHAGRLTTGELAARIKKLATALDPEWAARRYAAAVRDRDVIGYLAEDGTATVTGRRLPAEQAAAACARIEDLAKAAKRAGYPGRIGPLRADIYIGLLDGRWTHHSRGEIITDLLAQATPPDQPTPGQSTPDGAPQRPTPDNSFVAVGAPANGAPTTNDDPRADDAPEAGSVLGAAGAAGGDVGFAADAAAETDTPAGDTATGGKAGESAHSRIPGTWVGVELRVGLSTLLGHDRHPGEIPGWGTVTAETARVLATAQRRAEWRYAITDPEGRLILGGITRRRPSAPAGDSGPGVRRPPTAREPIQGGIVELHIPAALLTELAAHPETCGLWTAVVGDIATQYRTSATDAPDGAGGTGKQDPSARFAGTPLRRHVQIRDRTCVYPGCRCSARHADLDHTLDHGRGGVTTEANSGPLCRHDHRLKHEGGCGCASPSLGILSGPAHSGGFITPGPNRSPPIYPTRCQGRSTSTPRPPPPTTSTNRSSTVPHPDQTRHPHRYRRTPATRTNPEAPESGE